MYSNKFVASIKVNNKVLREEKENVFIPFGSEYKIFLKNLNSVRALVSIDVDGKSITGDGLVLDSFQSIDLARAVSLQNEGYGFKFIERTQEIEQNGRGVKSEDGLIVIRVTYEKQKTFAPSIYLYSNPFTAIRSSAKTADVYSNSASGSMNVSVDVPINFLNYLDSGVSCADSAPCSDANYSLNNMTQDVYIKSQNDVGITVEGSINKQQFHSTTFDEDITIPASVMVFHLKGFIEGQEIKKPVTVKTKKKCGTCGKQNSSNAKFCDSCGTNLQIINQ